MEMFKILVFTICCTALLYAQNTEDITSSIGVLPLNCWSAGGEDITADVVKAVRASLDSVREYNIHSVKRLRKIFEGIGEKLPGHCAEPRCAVEIGETARMDRVIFGSVDKNDKTYGVDLTLMDVPSRQIIEQVKLEGEPGVSLVSVIDIAVKKLHGETDEALSKKTHKYFGPQINNLRQLAVSAPVCIGAGIIWGLVNMLSNDENADVNGVYGSLERDMNNLYGVSTGADLIPLFGRPGALANAYVAASDDAYGVFFNPAGLSWVSGPQVSVGYQHRFGLDNLAISYVNKATREIGFGQGLMYSGDRDGLLSELYFISSFSYKFNELFSFLRPVSIGASIKIQSKKAGGDVSLSSISAGSMGVGIDFGLKWEISEQIHYGLLFKDLIGFDRWNNKSTGREYSEIIAPALSMGGGFMANPATFLIAEGKIPLNEDQAWGFAGGIERIAFKVIRFRLGIDKEAALDTPWKFTGGFGLKVKNLILDGSYEYNTLQVFSNPVNISLRYEF